MIKSWKAKIVATILAATGATVHARLSPEQVSQLPPPAARTINFEADVKPILEQRCVKCHARGKDKGGFSLETRAAMLKGGDSGQAVMDGHSAESYLIALVSGLDADSVMPKKGSRLTGEQVSILRAWIDQGLSWDAKITFARPAPLNLTPIDLSRKTAEFGDNLVDSHLERYLADHKLTKRELVNDRVFARRVYMDLVGLLPSSEQVARFVASNDPEKRARLVNEVLADREGYATHWLSFWNDLLRNDYRGTGYIDGGRKQITSWLYSALANDVPYDQFVSQLVNPGPESEGFAKGIVWRGVVNASQVPPMQAAQNISQVFLGVNLKCASCHDSFINDWSLSESYALANLYADEPLEISHCDQPTGKKAGYGFLFPQLGAIKESTNKVERLEQLARIITSRKNGRLPRTIVNRVWARLYGRGLVEPLDDMDNRAWDQELLDALADDLVTHGYDLKRTIRLMATARAYQWKAVNLPEHASTNFVFTGPAVKRMSAEQFRDAVGQVTGRWYESPAGEFDFSCLGEARANPESPSHIYAQARWIWDRAGAAEKAPPGTVYFRREVKLPSKPTEAFAYVDCDNRFTLYVNGKKLGEGKDYARPQRIDLRNELHAGRNILAIEAVNDPGDDKGAENPAGFLFYARIRHATVDRGIPVEQVMDVVSDKAWLLARDRTDGWEKLETQTSSWEHATELGGVDAKPWEIGGRWSRLVMSTRELGRSRAALANADILQVAMGRPNREQVVTSRASAATTLQALELTNGRELDELMKGGAEHWLKRGEYSSLELVADIYRTGLGRRPSASEELAALSLVGVPARADGVQDLLWAMCMLPEFQLIY